MHKADVVESSNVDSSAKAKKKKKPPKFKDSSKTD